MEWNLKKAQAMRAAGLTLTDISKVFEISRKTVKMKLDKEYAEKVRREWRERRKARQAKGIKEPGPSNRVGKIRTGDLDKRFAEVPYDTRGLTARVFGDPIPGDHRRAAWGGGH